MFVVLYVVYKLIYGTRVQSLKDFEDAYFLPAFDGEPPSDVRPGWRGVLEEIWSLVR